jgi:hypothetical protein
LGKKSYPSRAAFIFGDPPGFYEPLVMVGCEHRRLEQILLAFKSNLSACIHIANMPYRLAHSSTLRQRLNMLIAAQRIRNLNDAGVLSEEGERLADQRAHELMTEELADQSVIHGHAIRTLEMLDWHLSESEFSESARELLRQVVVMAWGALETVLNDTLRLVLNEQPRRLRAFADSKSYREFLSGRVLLDALEEHQFDVSSIMGDIFLDLVRLDALERIREATHLAFADDALDIVLKDSRLWRISQQRHLIVHRRGIADGRYLERTDDKTPVGSAVIFDAPYVEECLFLVRDAGCAILATARNALRASST